MYINYVSTQKTYSEKTTQPQLTFLETGLSSAYGALGTTNYMSLSVEDTGSIPISFQNFYGDTTYKDYSNLSNVSVQIRYKDSTFPVSSSYRINVYVNEGDGDAYLYVYLESSGALQTPNAATHIIFAEADFNQSITAIAYPYLGTRQPRSILDGTIRCPFYVDLSDPDVPVSSEKTMAVTKLDDNYYSVQTKWSTPPVFCSGVTRINDNDITPSIVNMTVPIKNETGIYFEFRMDTVTGEPLTSLDYIGVYFNFTLATGPVNYINQNV